MTELAIRLEGEVESATAGNVEDSSAQAARLGLLQQAKETQATGRLVVDLAQILQGNNDAIADDVLQEGDMLLPPSLSQTVTVTGEVQFPTSHIFDSNVGQGYWTE